MEKKFEPFDHVLVRDNPGSPWSLDIFMHYIDTTTGKYKYACMRQRWAECIHYEGNESLAFTANEPLPPMKWGDKVRVRHSTLEAWTNAIFVAGPDVCGEYAVYTSGGGPSLDFKYCEPSDW